MCISGNYWEKKYVFHHDFFSFELEIREKKSESPPPQVAT